eukprot:g248.t1
MNRPSHGRSEPPGGLPAGMDPAEQRAVLAKMKAERKRRAASRQAEQQERAKEEEARAKEAEARAVEQAEARALEQARALEEARALEAALAAEHAKVAEAAEAATAADAEQVVESDAAAADGDDPAGVSMRQKLDFSGTHKLFSESHLMLTVRGIHATRRAADTARALVPPKGWVEVCVAGGASQLTAVASARQPVGSAAQWEWNWEQALVLELPRGAGTPLASVQFFTNIQRSQDAAKHEVELSSLRVGEPVRISVDDGSEHIECMLLLSKQTHDRAHAVKQQTNTTVVSSATAVATAAPDASASQQTFAARPPTLLTTARHTQLELHNAERASALVLPRLNRMQLPYRINEVPEDEFQTFLVHQFAIDLINDWKSNKSVIDQLSGDVPVEHVADDDADVKLEMAVLFLAGDGRLKHKYMDKVKPELLELLDLEDLDAARQFRSGRADEALDLADTPDPRNPRLYYTDAIRENLDEWFGRGIAAALHRSILKGRGVMVVDSGYESELVSRLAHHLSMWRMPTLRIIGVAQNDNDLRRPERAARKMDTNHSHFVVCPKHDDLGVGGNLGDEDAALGSTSAGVDTVEKIADSFESTVRQIQQVRHAVHCWMDSSQRPAAQKSDGGRHRRAPRGGGGGGGGGGGAKVAPNADRKAGGSCVVPKVCLVINGGKRAKVDVLCAVRKKWDIIVVKGTGGLADWIALNWAMKKRLLEARRAASELDGSLQQNDGAIDDVVLPDSIRPRFDPVVDEIVTYGRMTILDIAAPRGDEDIAKLLFSRLNRSGDQSPESSFMLQHAWKQYASFRVGGSDERFWNIFCTAAILFFSSATTVLAVSALQIRADLTASGNTDLTAYDRMSTAVAIAPIFLALFTAVKNRFHTAGRWRKLYLIAERIYQEISLYRTGAGAYENVKFRDVALCSNLGICERSVLSSEAGVSKLVDVDSDSRFPADWLRNPAPRCRALNLSRGDEIMDMLDANRYMKHRLGERLAYFRAEASRNAAWLSLLSWSTFLIGGASTLLVMFDHDMWASVTVALQSTLSTLISTEAYEVNMLRANKSKVALEELRDWWHSLSETEQMYGSKRKQLVDSAERVIDKHMQGWLVTIDGSSVQQGRDDDGEEQQASTGRKNSIAMPYDEESDDSDGRLSGDEEEYLKTARPFESAAAQNVLEQAYDEQTIAAPQEDQAAESHLEVLPGETKEEDVSMQEFKEGDERITEETMVQESKEDEAAQHTAPAKLRRWARSTLLQISAVDQSKPLLQLPTQANALGEQNATRKASYMLSLKFRNHRKACAMVLPQTTDFRTIPDSSLNRFVNNELLARGAAKFSAAAASGSVPGRPGLGVIVLAGDGTDEGGLQVSPHATGQRLRAEKRRVVKAMANLHQLLCRAVPDAVGKMSADNASVVLVDSGNNGPASNLLANALISAWRFKHARVVGVMELESRLRNMFTHADQNHTHFVVLKQRIGIDPQYLNLPDPAMQRTSNKIDVAEKIAHSFCESATADEVAGLEPIFSKAFVPEFCRVNAPESSVVGMELLSGLHSASEQTRDQFSVKRLAALKDRIEAAALRSGNLAPVETQWKMNATELLERLHGSTDKVPGDAHHVGETTAPGGGWTSHVVFVIGGGAAARVDALQAVRLGWDIIVFGGTGGLADKITSRMHGDAQGGAEADGIVDEIVTAGRVAVVDVEHNTIDDVASLVYSRLAQGSSSGAEHTKGRSGAGGAGSAGAGKHERILKLAWTTCAEYTMTANALNSKYRTIEAVLMLMALWTTLLVAFDSDLRYNAKHWSASVRKSYDADVKQVIKVFIGITPILISVVIAVKSRFQYFAKCTALRAQAGAIVREIYHYRTNTGAYHDAAARNGQLATRLRDITAQLMNTAGAETAITSCGGGDPIELAMERDASGRATKRAQRYRRVLDLHESGDNGVDDMSVDEYARVRLERELERYRNRAWRLHFQVKALEYAGYILTGLCTALILVDEEVWVAALIVLVNVTANVAAVGMLEDRLVRTNGAIVKLDNLGYGEELPPPTHPPTHHSLPLLLYTRCPHI